MTHLRPKNLRSKRLQSRERASGCLKLAPRMPTDRRLSHSIPAFIKAGVRRSACHARPPPRSSRCAWMVPPRRASTYRRGWEARRRPPPLRCTLLLSRFRRSYAISNSIPGHTTKGRHQHASASDDKSRVRTGDRRHPAHNGGGSPQLSYYAHCE